MKWIVCLAFCLVTVAEAHVEPGVYQGKKADGSACSMTAGATYFEKGVPHPLNERVPLTVNATDFAVGHPALVDSQNGSVFFNHDLFQGVVPTTTGARALEVEMEHSEQFEGPRAFTFVESFWREKRSESYRCAGLQLVR